MPSYSEIRSLIDAAIAHEQNTQALATTLQTSRDNLHKTISLSADGSIDSLVRFVEGYVGRVPDMLEAALLNAGSTHVQEYIAPYLTIAREFFTAQPKSVDIVFTLTDLMDEAYLAHRLLEEVNEGFVSSVGVPLIPLEITQSNLVIHSLIGEPFANELDEIVEALTRHVLNDEFLESTRKSYAAQVERSKQSGEWDKVWQNWPSIGTDNNLVSLVFNEISFATA